MAGQVQQTVRSERFPQAKPITLFFLARAAWDIIIHHCWIICWKTGYPGFLCTFAFPRTPSWIALHCSMPSRATHLSCTTCSKKRMSHIWKRSIIKFSQAFLFWSSSTWIHEVSLSLSQAELLSSRLSACAYRLVLFIPVTNPPDTLLPSGFKSFLMKNSI